MNTTRVVIIGGGLSGLYAAWLLEQRGLRDYVLLEAREALGGRILPLRIGEAGHASSSGFDLGPTWFWPSVQPRFARLIAELGLRTFAQSARGDLLVERPGEAVPRRVIGYVEQSGERVLGGMNALIDALTARITLTRVRTGERVRALRMVDDDVVLESEDRAGAITNWRAQTVLMALPPRLADSTLQFSPALPRELAAAWRSTATWMAPHAKYVAVYDTAFWHARGLSGEARSARGPMAEIHDASMPGAQAALFGFLGVPATVRAGIVDEVLREHCRAQLARLFGEEAAHPLADGFKDWASDPLTASPADLAGNPVHGAGPPSFADHGPWQGRMIGMASEWSREYPGYLAGAIDAAERAVESLCGTGHPISQHCNVIKESER